MRSPLFLLCAILLAAPCAHATDSDDNAGKVIDKPVLADDPAKFATQNDWIAEQMKPGGRYEFIKPAEKQRVTTVLAQMASLLARSGSVDAMNHDTRLQLFNDQEEVNGILKHNDSNRLVCESRAPIGSHIPVTTCHTWGQIATAARNTQYGMDKFDSSRQCNGGAPQSGRRAASTGNSLCGNGN